VTPEQALDALLRSDEGRDSRQVGIVSASGGSVTYTGSKCNAWAGGRHGPGYAVQGNILTGEPVVAELERGFLESKGKPLAERLYLALKAGDAAGGDSRGHQSAALVVVRDKGGYNGFTDRAIDIRVDDHADPIGELGRLLEIAVVNDYWNRGWTAFTEKRFPEALRWQERTAEKAERQPAVLPEVLYDLGVIRLANGDRPGALTAVRRALSLNPKLEKQALADKDLEGLRPELGKKQPQ
jgi:tetratricopeptide (TPR) repeat protein